MAKASIYDLLHQHEPPVVETPVTRAGRGDYRTDRLRLIDGVALTPAGVVAAGEVPEPSAPVLATDLQGPDGFRLLVQPVGEVMPVDEPRLGGRGSAKARRLHELVQTISIDALMLLDALPDGAAFDIVLSAPLRSPQAIEIILDRLRRTVDATEYGEGLGDIRHSTSGWDPHATLAVPESGGQPYVLWISADSLLNHDDIARLHHRRLLALSSRPTGVSPGEAAVALLMQRVLESEPEEADGSSTGWWLDHASGLAHPERSTLSHQARHRTLRDLLAQAWPESDEDREAGAPAYVVMDAQGLPGRTMDVIGPLIERWPMLDVLDDGVSVDAWCGWPGEALTSLQLVLAMASLAPEDGALVLNLVEERRTRALVLHAGARAVDTDHDTGAATSSVDGRGS